MIKNVLSAIGGIGIYGILSLLLFFAVFTGMLIWAFALRKPYLARMGGLPLEPDTSHRTGELNHE